MPEFPYYPGSLSGQARRDPGLRRKLYSSGPGAARQGNNEGGEAGDKDLPLSTTDINVRRGVIRWAFLNADYRQYAEPVDTAFFQ